MIKRVLAGALAGFLLAGSGVTAFADDVKMVDKDEVIEVLWEENWHGRGDNGYIFPEASYKRHILEEWVNDNYGSEDYSWYDIGQIKYSYADYYKDLVSEWDFEDDEDGGWFITTPEHEYSFRLISGKWNMIDENGDTADTFMPFSTLEDDVTENTAGNVINDEGDDSPRVIGEPARGSEAVTASSEENADKGKSGSGSAVPLALCGVAVVGGTGAFIYFRKKK